MQCLLGHLSQIKCQNITYFVEEMSACTCLVMVPKSRYLKSVNHKIVTWNTNRPRRLYVTISFNLLFLYIPIFSLNCVCCHLFSADNISVFMYNFIHFDSMKFILNHIDSPQIPAKNCLRNYLISKRKQYHCCCLIVVNIGQDAQWNVNKHRICKLFTTDCVFLEIFDFDC